MTNLIEAASLPKGEMTGKTWRIKVIEGDRQGSSAYYPKEVLESGAHLFAKGTRIYGDHPTVSESKDRPERSYRDIIGVFESDAEFDGKDLFAEARFFEDHQKQIRERAEAGVIGMSIRAEGEVTEAGGRKSVTKFTRVNSVDVVTVAGAGGGFDKLLESERNQQKEQEQVATLEEALDQLVADSKANAETLKAIAEALKPLEEKKTPAAKAEDAKDGSADDDEEDANGNKKKKKPPFVKESASFAAIDAALTEAKLTPVSRAAVIAAVEAGADLKESITAEAEKVKAILAEAGSSFGGFVANDGTQLSEAEVLKNATASVFG